MELKGSQTEKNLWTAFAGESQARNKYTYYASKAKKEGFVQIAKIFEETANNEKEHAKIWFKELHGGEMPATTTNLLDAATGESFFTDGSDGGRDNNFLQVLAVPERLMVDAVDTGRQFDALDGLIALERTGGYESCSLRYHKSRFDGLIGGNQDGVQPQTTFRPFGLIEHNPRSVKSRTIDAFDGGR